MPLYFKLLKRIMKKPSINDGLFSVKVLRGVWLRHKKLLQKVLSDRKRLASPVMINEIMVEF